MQRRMQGMVFRQPEPQRRLRTSHKKTEGSIILTVPSVLPDSPRSRAATFSRRYFLFLVFFLVFFLAFFFVAFFLVFFLVFFFAAFFFAFFLAILFSLKTNQLFRSSQRRNFQLPNNY
jgi:hypothetical protein